MAVIELYRKGYKGDKRPRSELYRKKTYMGILREVAMGTNYAWAIADKYNTEPAYISSQLKILERDGLIVSVSSKERTDIKNNSKVFRLTEMGLLCLGFNTRYDTLIGMISKLEDDWKKWGEINGNMER